VLGRKRKRLFRFCLLFDEFLLVAFEPFLAD